MAAEQPLFVCMTAVDMGTRLEKAEIKIRNLEANMGRFERLNLQMKTQVARLRQDVFAMRGLLARAALGSPVGRARGPRGIVPWCSC